MKVNVLYANEMRNVVAIYTRYKVFFLSVFNKRYINGCLGVFVLYPIANQKGIKRTTVYTA